MCQVSCFYHKLHDYPLKWHLSIGLLNNICGRIFSVKSVIGVFYRYIVYIYKYIDIYINLFLKISVLQANLFWLGDFEKIICPWKESVSLERTIQGVRGYLISQNAVMWYLSETHVFALPPPPPPQPTKGLGFAL